MKRIIAVVAVIMTVFGITFSAMGMEKLSAPSWIEWRYEPERGGVFVYFEKIEGAQAYQVEIFKDGELVREYTTKKAFSRLEMTDTIVESGTYTLRMKILGDGVQTSDSQWSSLSQPYVYVRPEEALGAPKDLRWSEENLGTVEWTGLENDADCSFSYKVQLYRNKKLWYEVYTKKETSADLSQYVLEEGDYTFSVRAISFELERVAHGTEVTCEEPLDYNYTGQLPAPSKITWRYEPEKGGLFADFERVKGAYGLYIAEFYKDGELMDWMKSVNAGPSYKSIRMSHRIFESGSYTVRMKAVGDGVKTTDSEWSAFSEPYVYEKPEESLGTPRDLKWSDEHTGTAEWTGIDHADDYFMRYRVDLYKGDEYIDAVFTGKDTSVDLSKYVLEQGEYTFYVRAVSDDIEKVAHGDEIMCETPLNVADNNNKVLNDLEDLNSQIRDKEASPSDAERALEQMDIEDVAVAVQSSEESLRAMAELEEGYLELTGKSVEKYVDSDINLDSDEIHIIGAGLNIASSSNAVRVNFQKPEKEAEINNIVYKNTVQMDIGLTGSTESLRAPVTLIMPVPENINPSRLRILHFHKDGTYEIIKPVFTEEGKAKFTVTSFSVFAFAEEVEKNQNSGGNMRPSGGGGSSSSSGGTKKTETRSGSWVQSEKGWWFKEADGSWPANQWKQLMWNGSQQWYFFDQEGYMKTGWLDWNGKWYYLHPVSDGTMGHMYTGWGMIDGLWYYFGSDGALMVNSATPDGYQTDSNGVWIQ